MAEQFLEEIYKEAKVLFELKRLVELTRIGDPHAFKIKYDQVSPLFEESCKRYAEYNYRAGMEMWFALAEFIQNGKCNDLHDFVRFGDCLEEKVIPKYQAYISQWGNICVDDGQGFCLKSSKSGFLTMEMTDSGKLLYSGIDPMWEAYLMAKRLFNFRKESYALWGCGLGYLPYQLYCYTNGTAKIKVFEPNEEMVEYGRHYGVLDWIPEENLEIVVSGNILPFLNSIAENNSGFYIHEPAFSMLWERQREEVEHLMLEERTRRGFLKDFQINTWQNSIRVQKTILDFDTSRVKKEMIVVAAGSSLDEDMEYLRAMQGKKTIIAVGTVFFKLVKNGIRPDIVTILDPMDDTIEQIEGLYSQEIPLFLSTCAYWEIAAKYEGEKYLVLTDISYELPSQNAKRITETAMQNGGTVTFFSINIALFLGAAQIELVGVDLAYPEKFSHATDTPTRHEMDTSKMILTERVGGGKVPTTTVFYMYRDAIERLIAIHEEVRFINRSKIGARIKGTEEI